MGLTKEQLEEMRAFDRAATPGPWVWWTSNSFRRLSSGEGRDGDVLHATVQPSDGHPDIIGKDADRWFIEKARTFVPQLLDEVARLKRREAQLCEAIRNVVSEDASSFYSIGYSQSLRDAITNAFALTQEKSNG